MRTGRTLSRGAERIARAVRDATGLRTVFHPHCAGWVETPAEIARFLDLTDPDVIGLCFDTGHFTYGGGEAAAGLARFAARVGHVHFKDCSPTVATEARARGWDYSTAVGQGVFCELGAGTVDFPRVLQPAARAAIRRLDRRGTGCVARHGHTKRERAAQPGVSCLARSLADVRNEGRGIR